MKNIVKISQTIGDTLDIESEYIYLILISIAIILLFKLLSKIIIFLYLKIEKKSRRKFFVNQRVNIIFNILMVFSIFLVWEDYLTNAITVISFISAGITIAIRDIIYNLFAGMFIKFKKPFALEDRVEINGVKGDVVVINALSFKVLEIADRINGEQSSGIIVNIPNSFVFTYALKNYTTAFKYIWDEIVVNIPFDSDVEKVKKELLKIVNNNEIVKSIPKKMEEAVDDASIEYRIYYNHLTPIIYTKIVENHIELSVRFLVHPKKVRTVEDDIWLKILDKNRQKKIILFQD